MPDDVSTGSFKIMFGRGGFATLILYDSDRMGATRIDITRAAAMLAGAGARVPRAICPPRDSGGRVTVSVGEGGRALWIDGGGDVSGADLGNAICTAFEHITADQFDEMVRLITEPVITEQLTAARRALADAHGLTPRQAAAFLGRKRPELDGHSIRGVLESTRIEGRKHLGDAISMIGANAPTAPGIDPLRAAVQALEIIGDDVRTAWPFSRS